MLETHFQIFTRLLLACILGGIIGYERESSQRPAGFRTHTLVCIGATLVMITSEYMFKKYSPVTSIDPSRLGAQIISGIGFLGAGTILREGFSVKGLTTAASIWAVSCVGIAVGIGFYEGAVVASAFILITLFLLKKIEGRFNRRRKYRLYHISFTDMPSQIADISSVFEKHKAVVRRMEFTRSSDEKELQVKVMAYVPDEKVRLMITDSLYNLQGVKKITED